MLLRMRKGREMYINGMGDAEHATIGRPPRTLVEAAAVAIALKMVGCEDAIP